MERKLPETGADHVDEATRADAVADTHPVMTVGVLSSPQAVLLPVKVGLFIDHEAAALHPDGVAAIEEARQVRGVIAALNAAPGEVLVLIEDNLQMEMTSVSAIDRNTSHLVQKTCRQQKHFTSLIDTNGGDRLECLPSPCGPRCMRFPPCAPCSPLKTPTCHIYSVCEMQTLQVSFIL